MHIRSLLQFNSRSAHGPLLASTNSRNFPLTICFVDLSGISLSPPTFQFHCHSPHAKLAKPSLASGHSYITCADTPSVLFFISFSFSTCAQSDSLTLPCIYVCTYFQLIPNYTYIIGTPTP